MVSTSLIGGHHRCHGTPRVQDDFTGRLLIADAAGTIAITFQQAGVTPGGSSVFLEGNLNGLQLRTAAPVSNVPEPTSLALAAAGLALAAGFRRRGRR